MNYSIGDVEKITGVKSHILRYWEEEIPALNPSKNSGGRRTYSQSDLELIMRLKYLIVDRGFTVQGAQKQLLADTEKKQENMDTLYAVHQVREELVNLLKDIKH